MGTVLYLDIGYMNDQNDRADLLARLGLDYLVYLDQDGLLDLTKAGALLSEVEQRKHLLDEIEDPDEKGYYLHEHWKFVRFVEREMREVSSDDK